VKVGGKGGFEEKVGGVGGARGIMACTYAKGEGG